MKNSAFGVMGAGSIVRASGIVACGVTVVLTGWER